MVQMREMLAAVLDGGRVLDAGCGEAIEPLGSRWTVGLDLRVARAHNYASPVQGSVMELPFRSGAFRGVLAKDVLEHLDDVVAGLVELRRVVGPGGDLVFTVPRAVPRAVWADPTHRRGFTRQSILLALEWSGWRTTWLRRVGSIPGFGRLGLERAVPKVCSVPLVGHYFGTNWWGAAYVPEEPG